MKHHKSLLKAINPSVLFLIVPAILTTVFIIKLNIVDLPKLESLQSSAHSLDSAPKKPTNQQLRPIIHTDTRYEHNSDVAPLLTILRQAGFDTSEDSFQQTFLKALPKWSDVTKLYGEKPRIIGLETCQAFRESVKDETRKLGVAGNFNSGTNFLYELLQKNCQGATVLWQVPWGKHYPAYFRCKRSKMIKYQENSSMAKDDTCKSVLPIVTVRDPYFWMQSQCRQPYNANFDHNKSTCPNIIPYDTDILDHKRYAHMKYVPIRVTYSKDPYLKYKFQSLAHFWNGWNDEYVGNRTDNFPRLIVRLEDLVFRGQEVIPQLCECGGFKARKNFHHKRTVANRNSGIDRSIKNGAGLLQSIIRYGNPMTRRKGYTPCQLWAAKDILDPRLMETFGYHSEEQFGPDPSEWEDCFAYLNK